EKAIQNDLDDSIDTIGKKMTVCQLYAKKNGLRKNIRLNTKKGRHYLMKILNKE
ncbi:TPA: integrase, partial [Clostridioides difficile]|nr:integrase [Clostridioides difficile]HEK8831663.1 integrase [Clostridioides difficile]